MRTWFCLSLIKRNNYRNSSSSQLLASCSNESLESTSINETTADLSATAILFSFLNLARDSADALHSFAPAVMVTDLMNLSSVPLMHRDLCDLGSGYSQRNATLIFSSVKRIFNNQNVRRFNCTIVLILKIEKGSYFQMFDFETGVSRRALILGVNKILVLRKKRPRPFAH